jgi:hypothetical protein
MPDTHLIVLFAKKAYDQTVEGIKKLSPVPIEIIPYGDAQEYMEDFIEAKHMYVKIRHAVHDVEHGANPDDFDTITEREIDHMLSTLHVKDLDREWLQTVVILDDVGGSKLFNNESSAFNNWLRLSRDINVIWFLNLHSLGQLPPSIRSNAAVVYASKTLSSERMAIVHRQANSGVDWQTFREAVERVKRDPKARWVVIDSIGDRCHIE